ATNRGPARRTRQGADRRWEAGSLHVSLVRRRGVITARNFFGARLPATFFSFARRRWLAHRTGLVTLRRLFQADLGHALGKGAAAGAVVLRAGRGDGDLHVGAGRPLLLGAVRFRLRGRLVSPQSALLLPRLALVTQELLAPLARIFEVRVSVTMLDQFGV